jgi:cytochrome P450
MRRVATEREAEMTLDETPDLYWDPYDADINMDPYPLFRRLRDDAPLYYNERYDFFALSRADDVERALVDHERLSSARSNILELIRSDMELPPGFFIFEDPPRHTMHRGVLSRVFTPKKMAALEPDVRALCTRCLDPLIGSGGFDFVHDFGGPISAGVIGMMLGIPERDQMAVRAQVEEHIKTESGKGIEADGSTFDPAMYADYIDWRAEHPSDDLMTALLNVEFDDEQGTTRRLRREEVLNATMLLAGAGNETTAKLIGWTGRLLADHPDQRRAIAEDPSLVPDAVEEILRFEPPGFQFARSVIEDIEFSGGTVPAGNVVVCSLGAANRDPRRFPDGDRFDIGRRPTGILTFSFGIHFCLGAALARLQGRVALEEVLERFPEWTVDEAGAVLVPSSTTRGYDTLPVHV